MIARAFAWYLGLTRRERVLVAIAAALAALVLLAYGLVLPLDRALHASVVRHREAVERSGRLTAMLAELDKPAAGRAATAVGPVDQLVATSAETAGMVIQSNQAQGNDAATVAITGASATGALRWLDGLSAQGIAVAALTMTPAADGSVALNATLRRVAR